MTEKKAMHIYKTVQAKIFAFARFLKAPYLFPVQSLVKMMTFIRTNLAPPTPAPPLSFPNCCLRRSVNTYGPMVGMATDAA